MDESPISFASPLPAAPPEARPQVILLATFIACLAGALAGVLVYQLISMAFGLNRSLDPTQLTAGATSADRWQVRLLLGLNHLGTFVLSGATVLYLFYRHYRPENETNSADWRQYLGWSPAPKAVLSGLALLLMAVSLPLVLFSLETNKALPLPDAFKIMEEQTNEAIKALLVMDSPWELLANLTIIALLPALGEELIFRGLLQKQLMRRIANPWIALVLGAAIFSFIHFQFEGFLPRMLLGLLLGWLYWRTGNFWIPVIAHFFNNGFQVVAQYLYGKDISAIDLEQDISIPWYAAIASFLLLLGIALQIEKYLFNQPKHSKP